MIIIPTLREMTTEREEQGKQTYVVCDVLDFFLENNNLYYFLGNDGDRGRIRCLRTFGDKYKIFAYKTMGVDWTVKYFFLDIEKQKLFRYNGGSTETLIKWAEYLLNGGTLEEAEEANKLDYDPLEGI